MPLGALTSLFGSSEYVAAMAILAILFSLPRPLIAGSCERDLAEIYRDHERLAERLAVWRSRVDPVLSGDHDAGYLRVIRDVVRARGTCDLDVVVVAPEQAVGTDVQGLFGAVGGEVVRPGHVQPTPLLALLLPRVKLPRLESRPGEGEGLGEIGPHRRADEVGQLQRRPRGLKGVTRERSPRLIQDFDDITRGGLDGDALRGERAAAVRGAERMVRFPLLVQAGPDEHVVEHAQLALEGPQGAALDQARRDGIQLTPALKAAVRLDECVKKIGHCSSFPAHRCRAACKVAAWPPLHQVVTRAAYSS